MRSFLLLLALLPLAAACGDGGVGSSGALVGGPCIDDRDCDYFCQHGGDFPDGTCTQRCSSQAHCPPGTACVDKKDGICLLLCRDHDECRLEYRCKTTKRIEKDGEDFVCID